MAAIASLTFPSLDVIPWLRYRRHGARICAARRRGYEFHDRRSETWKASLRTVARRSGGLVVYPIKR